MYYTVHVHSTCLYGYWAEERMEANKARIEPETKVESIYA